MKRSKLYPPLWFLLFAAGAFLLARLLPWSCNLGGASNPVAIILAISGSLLAFWARGSFHLAETTAHPFEEASKLITHGAYRLSRNPMYLGMLLVLCALVIWLENLSGLVLPPLFVLALHHYHILPEERHLTSKFGAAYLDYMGQTRRWI